MSADTSNPSVEQQINQLNSARSLTSNDPTYYPLIVEGILPIAIRPEIELREWCGEFLNEAFSCTKLSADEKTALALKCFDTILQMFTDASPSLKQSLVLCSCIMYPLLFKDVCTNPSKNDLWQKVIRLKTHIFVIWNESHIGVKAACIKFAQKVICVHSKGARDPRLADSSDISLNTIPVNHPVFNVSHLQAEGLGCLDRLLSVFTESPIQSQIITATLYALGVITRTRDSLSSKIFNIVLAFNPSDCKVAAKTETERNLQIKFIKKALKVVLNNTVKTAKTGTYANPIQRYVQNLSSRSSSKRVHPYDQHSNNSDFSKDNAASKRVRSEESENNNTAINNAYLTLLQYPGVSKPMLDAYMASMKLPTNIPNPNNFNNNFTNNLNLPIPPPQPISQPPPPKNVETNPPHSFSQFDLTKLPKEILQSLVESMQKMTPEQAQKTLETLMLYYSVLEQQKNPQSSTFQPQEPSFNSAPTIQTTPSSSTNTDMSEVNFSSSTTYPISENETENKAAINEEDDKSSLTKITDIDSDNSIEDNDSDSDSDSNEVLMPSLLTTEQSIESFKDSIIRIMNFGQEYGTVSPLFAAKMTDKDSLQGAVGAGIQKLAASEWNQESWILLLSRLVTRGLRMPQIIPGLDYIEKDDQEKNEIENDKKTNDIDVKDNKNEMNKDDDIKLNQLNKSLTDDDQINEKNNNDDGTLSSKKSTIDDVATRMSDFVRGKLFEYITGDFRGRIDGAVTWLTEEWYAERTIYNLAREAKTKRGEKVLDQTPPLEIRAPVYNKWAHAVLDNVIHYLESTDLKIFLRIVSDFPELSQSMLEKIKILCLDPDRSQIGFKALRYLILLRPPVKEECLDIVEDLYKNHPDTKNAAAAILKKFRSSSLDNK